MIKLLRKFLRIILFFTIIWSREWRANFYFSQSVCYQSVCLLNILSLLSIFLFFFCEFSRLFHDPIKSSWAIYKAHMNHVRRYIFCVFTRIDVFEYLFIERDEKKSITYKRENFFFEVSKKYILIYERKKGETTFFQRF